MTNKMTSPDSPSVARRLIREWDLCAAVLVAAAFLVGCLVTRRDLIDLTGVLIAGVASGAAIGSAAFVVMRNVSEMLGREDYGELVRVIDGDETRALRPFKIVASAALATSVYSLVLLLVVRSLSGVVLYLVLTPLLGLGLYSILGTITLVGVYGRHMRRVATLRRLRDENRLRERGAGGGDCR